MAAFTTILAAASLAVTGYSAYQSYKAGKEQTKMQKQQIAMQQKATNVQATRERIQAAREARIKRAQILASTSNMGLGAGTSGVAGATSSVQSQLGANIGTSNVLTGFAEKASQYSQRAADAASKGAMWQSIGNIGGTIFSNAGGFTTIFGGNQFSAPSSMT